MKLSPMRHVRVCHLWETAVTTNVLVRHLGSYSSLSPCAMQSESLLYSTSKVCKSAFSVWIALMSKAGHWQEGDTEHQIHHSIAYLSYGVQVKDYIYMNPDKKLLSGGILAVVLLQVSHQGSDFGTFLKDWIHVLRKDLLAPVGLTIALPHRNGVV